MQRAAVHERGPAREARVCRVTIRGCLLELRYVDFRTYVRTYAYVLVRIFVYARARVYVQDWPVYSMPREKILRDVAITDEPTHTVRQRQTGQHRDRTGPSRSVSGL